LDDYLAALGVCLAPFGFRRLAAIITSLAVAWWLYVPLHELSHAFGCLLAGGTVTRLEIDPLYGAAWLQRFFPFVAVGSEYAGQLTGFDTGGSDWVYLATDFAPFLWTIIVGVPVLRAVGRGNGRPIRRCLIFGAALPLAFAPFVSLTGDYYEMGSIIVSRLAVGVGGGVSLERWRSDDVFRLVEELSNQAGGLSAVDVLGIAVAQILGAALAFATYAAGTLLDRHKTRQSK
jgi:hypothetical protein